ncbi:unnamed protein product [Caretta caretta]
MRPLRLRLDAFRQGLPVRVPPADPGAASTDCPEASFIPPAQEAGGPWKLLCWHCKQSHPSPPFYLFILVVTPWQRQQ